jgi:hypothetical protein
MGERTRGTVRLARGVRLTWYHCRSWRGADTCYWTVWRSRRHLLEGHLRCPLARAEEVALHQASSRLIALHKLLQDAGWEATTRSASLLADRIYPEGSAERRTDHA